MTKIKLNWAYAKGEFDTDTLKLICIPARGKRVLGPDELDAELCIKDGMNYQIAEIHLGDVESSNVLCNEIARRWNEFNSRTNRIHTPSLKCEECVASAAENRKITHSIVITSTADKMYATLCLASALAKASLFT